MGELATFLLSLVGAAPEQKAEQARFKKNLDKLRESDRALDDILTKVEELNTLAKSKLDSDRPGVEKDVESDEPVTVKIPRPPPLPR